MLSFRLVGRSTPLPCRENPVLQITTMLRSHAVERPGSASTGPQLCTVYRGLLPLSEFSVGTPRHPRFTAKPFLRVYTWYDNNVEISNNNRVVDTRRDTDASTHLSIDSQIHGIMLLFRSKVPTHCVKRFIRDMRHIILLYNMWVRDILYIYIYMHVFRKRMCNRYEKKMDTLYISIRT